MTSQTGRVLIAEHAALISRVLAIPGKRADTTLVSFLTPAETAALLASPDRGSWLGRRDRALLLAAVQTGLRVSELTGLARGDVTLDAGANLRCRGKVADLLARHAATAARQCPSLRRKNMTPHTLRHTAAMNLLQAGVDTSTIALWLGHAGTKATQIYLHADLALKEAALARTSR
jgi:site-specific recombinase XerD